MRHLIRNWKMYLRNYNQLFSNKIEYYYFDEVLYEYMDSFCKINLWRNKIRIKF